MNKKGFTLIELLAIIVILAIIAVITVPIILNIIENARRGAARSSALGYADAIKLAYVENLYGETSTTGTEVKVTIGETEVTLYVNKEGNEVECDEIKITDGKLTIASCEVGSYEFTNYADGKFEE